METRAPLLIIACGAIARELVTVLRASGMQDAAVQCLSADLHNRPERITDAVRAKIVAGRASYERIYVAYGDCGTGGELDAMLEAEGVERLPGAHCYEFFAGGEEFAAIADEEPATFYLTDFLVRHFDRLVIRGLGLDRRPQLLPMYFGNYRRLLYLAQTRNPELEARAEAAAARLGLAYAYRFTGYGDMARDVTALRPGVVRWAS